MNKNITASIEEIIDELKNGKMVIMVDDEDRENEGDLIIPAAKADADAVNFMATHGRGLICLTLTADRVKKLNLPLMAQNNQARDATAFTISIESAEGVTTGISAQDRATTIASAIDPLKGQNDITSPGHVFPLVARDGGVLVRAGHTEASVDLARLAGFEPAGTICEIMNDDGTMARRADLEIFAKKHDLKIGTIADLIHYRNISEKSIHLVDEADIESEYGNFLLHAYEDTINGDVHIALIKGEIHDNDEVMVRVQQSNTLQDVMGINEFGSRLSFSQAMKKIETENKGVLLLLSHSETSQEILSNISFLKGQKTSKNNEGPDSRIVGVGAQILKELGIKKIRLLGASAKYPLAGFNLEITEFIN